MKIKYISIVILLLTAFSAQSQHANKSIVGWLNPTQSMLNHVHSGTSAANYYASTIFPDSTVRYESGGVLSYVWLNSAGVVFDPYSVIYDASLLNAPVQGSTSYSIDTISVAAWYKIVQAGHPDTLVVELVYGTPNTSPAFSSTYFLFAPDTFKLSPPMVQGDTSRFGFKCKMTSPNTLTFKYVLTAADSSLVNAKQIKIPIHTLIPSANIVGTSITFVPGNSYNAGDIVYSNSGTYTQTVNSFRVGVYVTTNTTTNPHWFSDLNKRFNSSNLIRKEIRYKQYTGTNAWQNTQMFSTLDWGFDVGFLTSTPTGINPTENSGIHIYPNPARHVLHIDAEHVSNATLEIFDIAGRKVWTQKLQNSDNQINVSHLTQGMYFLKISNSGNVYTEKLMIE